MDERKIPVSEASRVAEHEREAGRYEERGEVVAYIEKLATYHKSHGRQAEYEVLDVLAQYLTNGDHVGRK